METLRWEKGDGFGVLTFNRPEALNAINTKMVGEMLDWLEEVKAGQNLRTIIITGAGEKAFIAGADIKEMSNMGPKEAAAFAERGHQVLLGLQSLKCPVIAAVNGFALGGGCEMAMASDFILASENAAFGLPEVTLGLMPGFGGTQRLPMFVGMARASEMIFTGKKYSAVESLNFGLVNSVHPQADLMTAAKKIAGEIASRGPMAVASAKKTITEGYHLALKESLKLERAAFSYLFATKDMKEGTKAFVEKRPAQFIGE